MSTDGPSAAAALTEVPEAVLDAIVDKLEMRLRPLLETRADEASAPSLVSAAELARRLGRTRSWVYEHANDLGAIRLGCGQRPRLAFDMADVMRRLAARSTSAPAAAPQSAAPRRRRASDGIELLPVRGRSG